MLTPQEIQNREFSKAVFGGYDMTAVDAFLEEVETDYAALFKENAVLKSKLKVLVEKVEEYRSTEDSMRMALLTAQRMGDDIMEKAKLDSEKMIADANDAVESIHSRNASAMSDELNRLEELRRQTAQFVQTSQQLIEGHRAFLARFGREVGVKVPDDELEAEDYRQTVQAEEEPETGEVEMGDALKDIGAVITDALAEGVQIEEPDPVEETKIVGNMKESAPRRSEWTADDEKVTPRPKFNFDDLQFGVNYQRK